MEKSGPRPPHIKIIDQPALKSPLRHLVEGSITLFFWAVWIYWLMPIFTALMWLLGIGWFYREIFPQGGMDEFLALLRNAGIVFLAVTAILIVWTRYNYLWFLRRGERRNKMSVICHDEDVAKFLKADVEEVRRGKECSLVEVRLEGESLKIRCLSPR